MSGSSFFTEQAMKSDGGVFFMGHNCNTEMEELERIELAARTCYKSEDKITYESAEKMFLSLCRRKHYAMLRFGERAVILTSDDWKVLKDILTDNRLIAYWRWVTCREGSNYIVTANLNSWIMLATLLGKGYGNRWKTLVRRVFENWPIVSSVIEEKLKDTEKHEYYQIAIKEVDIDDLVKNENTKNLVRFCFRVCCNRGISHEIVRHTTLNYAQESTRWIAYKDNAEEMLFVPEHWKDSRLYNTNYFYNMKYMFTSCYEAYRYWLDNKILNAGDARDFLPHSLKTELCISGYLDRSSDKEFNSGFSHFIDMRKAKDAHKGIQVIAREFAKYLGYGEEEKWQRRLS